MKSLVFLDVETTGLSAKSDRIIEIYLLKVFINGDVQEYYSLVNPKRPIPKRITQITGIDDETVREAPTETEIASKIRSFFDQAVPVGHNLAFDLRFLNELFHRNQLATINNHGIDTLVISKKLFPKLCIYPDGGGSHRLKNLMYHFGLEKEFANSHRAKDDVKLLVQVYRHLERYAQGRLGQYPLAMTHGCPECGKAMNLINRNERRELVCSCQLRLVDKAKVNHIG
ncbi:MAG: 3'-5' exonuclease [Firmicutes bacterium]|nr:3'-5' exonuclease [Bacillota bacterium]